MSPLAGLLFLGYGGHARSVADVALSLGIPRLAFVEPAAAAGESFLGHPVGTALPALLEPGWACYPAAGDNRRRAAQVAEIRARGWPLASVVSPRATLGHGSLLGEGCFVGHQAHIGPLARIGEGCIVNSGAIVEHDVTLGRYVHVSVGTTVAGRATIGDFCFLGAGSTVIDKLRVAADVMLGAGAVAVRDIDEAGTWIGVPARRR